MDTIKSLASISKTRFVLLGTYDVLNLLSKNAQLDRRTTLVHLPRYRSEMQNDHASYLEILITFQKHLPLRNEPDLITEADYMYTGSLGCIGMLKTWLSRALYEALKDNERQPFIAYCRKAQVSSERLTTRFREILEGERRMDEDADEENNYAHLQSLLNSGSASERTRKASSETKPRTRSQPGKRNPVRDPIGDRTRLDESAILP
ncbi:MAG: hypothetical protein IPK19_26015 [Chloroflexi bacterium]|nr:hypothetical protein [Chloroflexota bacterium]